MAALTRDEAVKLLLKMRANTAKDPAARLPHKRQKPKASSSRAKLRSKLEDLKTQIELKKLDELSSSAGKHVPLSVGRKKSYVGKKTKGTAIVIDPIKTARLREKYQQKLKKAEEIKKLKTKTQKALEKTLLSDKQLSKLAKRVKRTLKNDKRTGS